MLAIFRLIYKELQKGNKAFYRDPRTCHLPLLGPPWKMFAVLALYFLVVKKIGPKLMDNRKPFNVKLLMQIYNVAQILLNFYIFATSINLTFLDPNYKLSCQGYNINNTSEQIMKMRIAGFLYYISKYLDLLDTVFFLLRKNYRQITFLHLYHHSVMIYAVWVYMTLLFGSHYTMTGVINSFVHVCMYSYYFVAALKPNFDLLPFKRMLTQLQIVQFCYLTIHFAMPIINNWCGLDLFWMYIVFLQNLFMLILFGDFYYRAYVLKPRRMAAKVQANGNANGFKVYANGKGMNGMQKVH